MISKSELEARIDVLLSALAAPLSAADERDGWTPAAREAFQRMLTEIQRALASKEDVPDVSLSRGLDSWGVVGGELSERAAELSNALREYRKRYAAKSG